MIGGAASFQKKVTTPMVDQELTKSSEKMVNYSPPEHPQQAPAIDLSNNAQWISSILTPYLLAAWSNQAKETEHSSQNSSTDPIVIEESRPKLTDLLFLAKRVDALEDEVSIKCAERDQARAQLEILRLHQGTERDELIRKQLELENELSNLRQIHVPNEPNEQEKKVQEAFVWQERAEKMLEQLSQEEGEPNMNLRSPTDPIDSPIERLEIEKQIWLIKKFQWDEERSRLSQRIAQLEIEKEERNIISFEERETLDEIDQKTSKLLVLTKERDDLANSLGDYMRRLDEIQSELLLHRAQRRIDERELKMFQRESEEKVFLARSELVESRLMIHQLREKLIKLKKEKKVLLGELRALREMGLYHGPLTRDGKEFGEDASRRENIAGSAEELSSNVVRDSQPLDVSSETEEIEFEKISTQAVLLELEERKRIVRSMLASDADSRSLQQLSLQLETQSQTILQKAHSITHLSHSIPRPESSLVSSPLPSHDEWLETSFRDWNSV